MAKEIKNNSLLNPKIWRYLVNLWTIILYFSIGADFFMRNGAVEFLGPICAVYVALLAIYTAEKEFGRWHAYHNGRHPGEIYVIIWTVIVVLLLCLEIITRNVYKIPNEVITTYIVVVGILAITQKSKASYKINKKGR